MTTGYTKKNSGFTLIELMIAVAIISIIAAIAIPSYNDSVRKTKRTDAKAALAKAATLQERYYTENNGYTNDITDVGGSASEEGYYTLSSDTSACASSCFVLTATVNAGGEQALDETCWTFTLDHTGRKASATKAGVANASKTCW